MNPLQVRTIAGAAILSLVGLTSMGNSATPNQTTRIVSAANAFLATLNTTQRASVLFPFDDLQQRQRWSNFPVVMVPRAGMNLKQMNAAQRAATTALLAAILSPRGLEKVQQIMEGDEVNKTTDQGPRPSGGPPPNGRGGNGPPPGPPPSQAPGAGNAPPPLGNRGGNRPPFGPGGPGGGATSSARTSTTSPSSEPPRRPRPGCSSSAAIIWL